MNITTTSYVGYSSLWRQGEMGENQHSIYLNRYKGMLSNLIPPEMVTFLTGLVYTDKQFNHFHNTLPLPEMLCKLRNECWVVIAGPPEPYDLWRILRYDQFALKVDGSTLPFGESINIDDPELPDDLQERQLGPHWIAFKKTPITKGNGDLCQRSWEFDWKGQQNLLSHGEFAPTALEVAWVLKIFLADAKRHPNLGKRAPLIYGGNICSDYTLTSTTFGGKRIVIGSCKELGEDFQFTLRKVPLDFNIGKTNKWHRHHVGLCPVQIF